MGEGVFYWWLFSMVAAACGGVWFIGWVTGRIRLLAEKRIAEAIPDSSDILLQDSGANFFGLESLGGMQLRGNGGLVLTARNLSFFMLVPRRDVQIPLASIEETSLVRSHCGKTVFRDLLKVTFRAGESEALGRESAAWYVRDAGAWKRAIDAARQHPGGM